MAKSIDFLTEQERTDLQNQSKWSLVGQTKFEDIKDYFFRNLAKAFQDFPVKWANSLDLLYSMPYDRDDFLVQIQQEKREEKENEIDPAGKYQTKKYYTEPWVYQDGRIFEAKLILERPKAFLLKIKFRKFWVPKAQVDFEPNEVWLPMWLIKDKELEDQIDEDLNPKFEWEPALLALGKFKKPKRKDMKKLKGERNGL